MAESQRKNDKTFAIAGDRTSPTLQWVGDGLQKVLVKHGHEFQAEPMPDVRFVLNFVDPAKPRPFRRKAQATFVMGISELEGQPEVMRAGYPVLVRSLSNMMMLLVHGEGGLEAHFLTIEQGHYIVTYRQGEDEAFFEEVYERIEPLASSELVINNVFETDLEEELWDGDENTRQLEEAGRFLDSMNLLPAPFPVQEILEERDLRHIYRLYGLGGLSYGNLSARRDATRFWMSASGVDKGKIGTIGEDILLVKDFDEKSPALILSVPPHAQPKRVSVDAIEHYMIYREHPDVGAIVHVHAWMDNIPVTEMNYPCGTREIALAVSELVRQQPEPARAVIGLKNHGVTITGRSMREILERVEGKMSPHVPMS